MEREPEAWQTNAPGAFLTIGDVSVWTTDRDQGFRIEGPAGVEEIEGFEQARRRARELAGLPPVA